MPFLIPLLLCALFIAFFWWSNNALETSFYTVKAPLKMRIVHISDLHGKQFGRDNARLFELVKAQQPELICITGDIVSRNGKNLEKTCAFASSLTALCPVYYVPGNHEHGLEEPYGYEKLLRLLEKGGVHTLVNEYAPVGELAIAGVDTAAGDPDTMLQDFSGLEEYRLLLDHFPHDIDMLAGKADMVLSGHAHGGQVRLPLLGGVIAPQQGLFPKYYQGLHEIGGTLLVISRGLGNSIIPVRLFNRPELVVIDLEK